MFAPPAVFVGKTLTPLQLASQLCKKPPNSVRVSGALLVRPITSLPIGERRLPSAPVPRIVIYHS